MRKLLIFAAIVATILPVAAVPTAVQAQVSCPPGTPIVVCICTNDPSRCYPGTFILRPR